MTELCDKGDLKDYIKNAKEKGEKIPEKTVFKLFRQICEGIRYIHEKKIIHRDLKPENIFIGTDPETNEPMPIIADFGLCKELIDRSVATTETGSRNYFSPEIIKKQSYDYSTDIFSLGFILYEMCTLEQFWTPEVQIDIYY